TDRGGGDGRDERGQDARDEEPLEELRHVREPEESRESGAGHDEERVGDRLRGRPEEDVPAADLRVVVAEDSVWFSRHGLDAPPRGSHGTRLRDPPPL